MHYLVFLYYQKYQLLVCKFGSYSYSLFISTITPSYFPHRPFTLILQKTIVVMAPYCHNYIFLWNSILIFTYHLHISVFYNGLICCSNNSVTNHFIENFFQCLTKLLERQILTYAYYNTTNNSFMKNCVSLTLLFLP